MKAKNNKLAPSLGTGPGPRRVRFELKKPEARSVCIAGTFNDWHPQSTPMIEAGAGRWVKDLMLSPGVYEYLFVVDGSWLPDPTAHDGVPNPFGGSNSRLSVG
jgi:1,4-alpha-glucan branching enzyme